MNVLLGLAILFASCIVGFLLSGGHLAALFQPYELLILVGSALGAMLISNPLAVTIATLKGIGGLIKPSPYKKDLYLDLLALLYDVFNKMRREGMLAVEADIDDPSVSPLFTKYPSIDKIHGSIEFVVDYLRVMMIGSIAGHELEALIDAELETHHVEAGLLPSALSKVADALPGFGIVAAVMGIVITMGSLGGPPAELGHHVAAALVGTFLGILLSYGIFGPLSTMLEHQVREESKFYECIKVSLIATLNGAAPQIAVEFGRKVLFHSVRPTYAEVDEKVRQK
ncbi:MAG TPA: flagellar motor stator protein MotA [Spongiibacteraceae bacterium]|nr:flagellar motor stator protein MotA [Spongiibacteraceae bacterium]